MPIKQMPENWELIKLADVAEVKYGRARPKDIGKIPVIGSGGIYGCTSKPLIDFPTIVIGRKGIAGLAWLREMPCWPSDTTFYLNWRNDRVDHHFLHYHLERIPLSGQHARTTLPSLLKQDLENYSFFMPPSSSSAPSPVPCVPSRTRGRPGCGNWRWSGSAKRRSWSSFSRLAPGARRRR